MTTDRKMTNAALTAGAGLASAQGAAAAEDALNELLAQIRSPDDRVRGPAWQKAGPYGAPAVKPLIAVMAAADMEVARAATRALWKIVRHAGRPGAEEEKLAVASQLAGQLASGPTQVRRELLWMLSEVGGDEAVEPVAALLQEVDLREDARAALQRIPGAKPLAALKSALTVVPEDYRPALAVSLRARGEKVEGYPSRRLVPTRQTTVKAVE